jgi:L-glyceraldehyde 3-phosphate reductase
MGLDYVDIFYHHRPDPETPLEETMAALDHIVRSGRALYVGLSNYGPEDTRRAAELLRRLGTPCLVHQPSYSLLNRGIEAELLGTLEREGLGCVVFSPLAQGLLSDRYLDGIPAGSRASRPSTTLKPERLTPELLDRVRRLDLLARARGQKLAQMALAWVLRSPAVTSAIIGASQPGQVEEAVAALRHRTFAPGELEAIDAVL